MSVRWLQHVSRFIYLGFLLGELAKVERNAAGQCEWEESCG